MRGIGTLFAGLVLLTALVGIAIYIVHVSTVATQAIHEQQMLYERARFIAEHTNISGNTISLPQPANLVIMDPQGIPHVAKNVSSVTLPWPASQSKIYVVETGRLMVGAADPVASSIAALASVAAAPLQGNLSLSGVYDCSMYLDPLLFSLTGSDYYRGYIPASVKNVTVKTYMAFPDDNPPGWSTVSQELGLPASWPIVGSVLAAFVTANDTALVISYTHPNAGDTTLRVYVNGTLVSITTVWAATSKNITIPGGWLWFYSNVYPWYNVKIFVNLGAYIAVYTHIYYLGFVGGWATMEIDTTITHAPPSVAADYIESSISVTPSGGVLVNTIPSGLMLAPENMELNSEGTTWDSYPTIQQITLRVHTVSYTRCPS